MILTEESSMNRDEIKSEYTSSLTDLKFNSKPLINVLTMLADEYLAHASDIVAAIEEHLAKVPTDVKLPILYLIDCISKNLGEKYTTLFSQNIVSTFCNVFTVVDEKTRAEMFKLRQTWNEIFPQKRLYAIDVQINMLDPAWPVTAVPPSNSIHFNPKFLKTTTPAEEPKPPIVDNNTFVMQQQLIQKKKELIELHQKKLELELLQTQVKLQKQNEKQNLLLKPEVAKQLTINESQTKPKVTNLMIPKIGQKIAPVSGALVASVLNKGASAVRPMGPIRDPRLLRQQAPEILTSSSSNSNNSVSLESKPTKLDSNNKIVTNTKSVRDSRTEPRLISNKDNIPLATTSTSTQSQNKKNYTKSSNSPSSFSSRHNSNNKTDLKAIRFKSDDLKAVSSSSLKSSSSSSLLDSSPTKKSEKNYSKSSPSKWSSSSSSSGRSSNKKKPLASSLKYSSDSKKSSSKDLKRERNQKDVDLRVHNGPAEKQARISEAKDDRKDVDLRQLRGSKKRTSNDNIDVNSKKSRIEVFDVLFGNEDVDLRTVLPTPQPERPPTPPPPIISLLDLEIKKPPTNLDEIRAKLANATGRDRIMAKSFNIKKRQPPDDEQRKSMTDIQKIIISSDDEQSIKNGKMTPEQQKQLANKIFAHFEHQKLREAKEKDKKDELQAVSDEEIDLTDEKETGRSHTSKARSLTTTSGDHRGWGRGGGGIATKRSRHWDPPQHSRPRPWITNPNPWRATNFPPRLEDSGKVSPDQPDHIVVDSVNQDDIKTIDIDGVPRDIRYYDETAIVFMNWDDPREISFQSGTRRVIFGDKESYLLSFNEPYKEVMINGALHCVRLGAPSREIFIDSKPYECYFGGPLITIDMLGRMCTIQLEGPAPQVKIGTVKRDDLVAGKVNLIIDAKILVPIFLDAKIQKFVIDGETHTLKFVDALKTVLINDVPFKVEFGGLPKPITVHDTKHFIRFSVLPSGVKPGHVSIKEMDGCTTQPQPTSTICQPIAEVERNSNSPHFFNNYVQQNNLEQLSNILNTSSTQVSSSSYEIEQQQSQSTAANPQPTVPLLPPTLNINDLFQKLVATGIVATKDQAPAISEVLVPASEPITPIQLPPIIEPPKRSSLESLKPISFKRPETLKTRQSLLYEIIYAGMQCSSCGMRFPVEQSTHYSQHLDWHFRQNRKGKKNIRVAASRRWYYTLSDWKNYEEIEDLEEREKNYFDQQQQNEGQQGDGEEEIETPSVLADPDIQDAHCDICEDKLDLFFNEDKEEWHLRNAIRVDEKTYHPLCYDDYLASLLEPKVQPIEPIINHEENSQTMIPGLEIVLDDDEDDDIKEAEPKEEVSEVTIEESDDSKSGEILADPDETQNGNDENDDDDVILHEVLPERIEIDDDKEYNTISIEVAVKPEQIDDGFVDVEEGLINMKNGGIQIKSEPMDHDEPLIADVPEDDRQVEEKEDASTEPEEFPVDDLSTPIVAESNTAQPGLISSMDGNIAPQQNIVSATLNPGMNLGGNKIKINISKQLPAVHQINNKDKDSSDSVTNLVETILDPTQPLPPGEEPIQLNVKSALRGIELKKMPTVQKGSELTGMCSIM